MKILVVDDDVMILKAIAHYLRSNQLEVILAENSLQALDAVEHNKLNLIICDIMMPGFSGLGLLSLLNNFYLTKIPVIIMSSLNKTDIISSSKKLGAVDYLTKPLNFKELVASVMKYINLNKQ